MVKMECLMLFSVKDLYIKRSAHGNDYLLACAMSMSTSTFSGRDIIGPVDTGNIKRHVLHLFRYRKIATRVYNLWKIYESYIIH